MHCASDLLVVPFIRREPSGSCSFPSSWGILTVTREPSVVLKGDLSSPLMDAVINTSSSTGTLGDTMRCVGAPGSRERSIVTKTEFLEKSYGKVWDPPQPRGQELLPHPRTAALGGDGPRRAEEQWEDKEWMVGSESRQLWHRAGDQWHHAGPAISQLMVGLGQQGELS